MTDPVLLRQTSERAFLAQVRRLATLTGWTLQAHHWRSDHSPAGWPDVVLARPDAASSATVLVAELKCLGGRPTVEQAAWLAALEGRTVRSFLWTPADWESIEAILKGEA